jgi:hypothetical protein
MKILRISKRMPTDNHRPALQTSLLLSSTANTHNNALCVGLAVSLLVE